jgi:polar amino acid transport system substrate-binding protein
MGVLFRAYRFLIALIGCIFFLSCCGKKTADFDYIIAIDPTWYALEAPGRETDLTAFTTELILEIGKIERISIGVYQRSWSNLMYSLQEGECDAICSTMQPYLFYDKLYRFSNLYLMTGPVLVSSVKSSFKSLEKMDGEIIGIERDSNVAIILEKYPNIIQRTYESIQQALTDITKGEIDGALVDILSAEAFTRDLFHDQLKIVTHPLTQEGVRILAMKDHTPELIKIFDRGLARLKMNGKYSALVKKWRLAEPINK